RSPHGRGQDSRPQPGPENLTKPILGYFDTDGANNGSTEAINGLIELHRRIARGFRNRDNYRLRMLLTGGGLNL
ncbi:transposase, partial [Nostocoides vanveenii]|uniref:transposase n=1 Tax=Nostocoides vanveenii TaxID=330835 RepID=UPI0031DC4DE5